MKLLYAEDERGMSEAVVDILEYHHYSVDAVYNGQDALDYARANEYDGIILDVMMPRMNGFDVLRQLRMEGNNTPVLFLSAKGDVEDRIKGLDLGADDYLPKPFAMKEFMARIRALLRRREGYTPEILTIGNVHLNLKNCELSTEQKTIILTNQEFQMMELLMLNQGIYLSSEVMLAKIWGYDTDAEIGIVWVYISNLRKKLDSLHANVQIGTKRNVGYTLEMKHD